MIRCLTVVLVFLVKGLLVSAHQTSASEPEEATEVASPHSAKSSESNPYLLADKPTLGLRGAAKSWEYKPEVHEREFANRDLPPVKGDGVLVLGLYELHANGLRQNDIIITIGGVQLRNEASYVRALGMLKIGQPIPVFVRRLKEHDGDEKKWETIRLDLTPVSSEAARILANRTRYMRRHGPAINGEAQVANAAAALTRHMLTSEKFTQQDFAAAMEQLENIASVMEQGGDHNAVIAALVLIPDKHWEAMGNLIIHTDWGRLRCGGHDKTNIEVWVGAWDVVIESLAEHGRVPRKEELFRPLNEDVATFGVLESDPSWKVSIDETCRLAGLPSIASDGIYIKSFRQRHSKGLQLSDIVIEIQGIEIVSVDDYQRAMDKLRVGIPAELKIRRFDPRKDGGRWELMAISVEPLSESKLAQEEAERKERHSKRLYRFTSDFVLPKTGAEIKECNKLTEEKCRRVVAQSRTGPSGEDFVFGMNTLFNIGSALRNFDADTGEQDIARNWQDVDAIMREQGGNYADEEYAIKKGCGAAIVPFEDGSALFLEEIWEVAKERAAGGKRMLPQPAESK